MNRPSLIIAAILAVSIPLGARAFDINDLIGQGDPTLQIQTGEAGLDGYSEQCREVRITEAIDKLKSGYSKQLVSDTLRMFTDNAKVFVAQIAACAVANITAFGNGAPGTTSCTFSISGFSEAIAKRAVLDKIEHDFLARCTADAMRQRIGDDVRRIIQENGPDGGAAYVKNWVDDIYVNEDQRAINRFNAILVTTDICPYFRDRVLAEFGVPQSYIDKPPSLTGIARVDGGDSFILRGRCTLPPDFTPERLDAEFEERGGFDALRLAMEPQNNYEGFKRMARAELDQQRAIAVRGAEAEAIGSGFRSARRCINYDPDGNCLADVITQPAGGLRDANAAVFQGEIDWVNNSKEMNTLVGDVRLRLVSMIMDMQQKALQYDVELDGGAQKYVDIAENRIQPDRVPDPIGGLSGSDPNNPQFDLCGANSDPSCTGGNSQCCCVRGSPSMEGLRQRVAEATRAAIQQHPELVSADGSSVVPGSERLFLQAICETTIGQSLSCHAHPGQNDEIVVAAGPLTVSVHVIASSGLIRIPGQTIAACEPGVQ